MDTLPTPYHHVEEIRDQQHRWWGWGGGWGGGAGSQATLRGGHQIKNDIAININGSSLIELTVCSSLSISPGTGVDQGKATTGLYTSGIFYTHCSNT